MDQTEFGKRLAAARKAKDLTQEQLGAGLGSDGSDLGKGAVSSWEVGGSVPNARQLAILRDRLGISVDTLLGLKSMGKRSPTNHPGERASDKAET